MNNLQAKVRNTSKVQTDFPAKAGENPNQGIDEMLILLRNRAVVDLLRDEEALFDINSFERCIQPPGNQARARIVFGLKEILDEKSAESLLAFLELHSWNFRFSLSLRDFRRTYHPHWLFCLFLFYLMWLILLLPFTVAFSDLTFFRIVLGICGITSVLTLCVYYEFKERKRLKRINLREIRLQESQNWFKSIAPHSWIKNQP